MMMMRRRESLNSDTYGTGKRKTGMILRERRRRMG